MPAAWHRQQRLKMDCEPTHFMDVLVVCLHVGGTSLLYIAPCARVCVQTRLASLEAAAKVVPGWAQQLARLAPHQLGNILWARSPVMARVR